MLKKIYIYIVFSIIFISNSYSSIEIKARTAILQDFLSGEILYEKEPNRSIYPASMTKIMTAIVAFDLIKSGDLSLDDKFIVSEKAWRLSTAGYSSMFIMIGDEVSVEDLLRGIFLGEYSVEAFGDYIVGTNHVLPTSGAAKFSSGLGVLDFMKRSSVVEMNQKSFYNLSEDTEKMSGLEGLDGHKLSVKIRQKK